MKTAILEKPMLFSGPMVRAILDGRKCQTRRVVKFGGPAGHNQDGYNTVNDHSIVRVPWTPDRLQAIIKCPHPVGSRIWVKETHYVYGHWDWVFGKLTKGGKRKWRFVSDADDLLEEHAVLFSPPIGGHRVNRPKAGEHEPYWYRRNSMFMPKQYARITLEVTDVRVQRLQEISEEDAAAEGTPCVMCGKTLVSVCLCAATDADYRTDFTALWNSINGPDSWQANPWVWAYTFKRVEDSHAG